MSNFIELPGLRGDDPLGFLAALGTLRLATVGLGIPARLHFAPGADLTARIDLGEAKDLLGLAEDIEALARQMEAEGRLLCGTPCVFPPKKQGTRGGDPARLSAEDALVWGRSAGTASMSGDESLAEWLVSVYCPRSLDEGRVTMTLFYAPSGQMTFAGNLAEPLRLVAAEHGHVASAFTRWRRVGGFTGANLDQRALRDAGVEPSGKPANRGAPGPTWLALQGLVLARLSARGDPVPSVLWQRRNRGERGRRALGMVWPTWSRPVDMCAVRALLDHPDLSTRLLHSEIGHKALDQRRRELGLTGLWRSERLGLSQSDGPLMSASRLWPESSAE
ncbi:MAG: type I-G CRISPR-associated protein, Cas3-extension family [Acidimicrobiales bacterium]